RSPKEPIVVGLDQTDLLAVRGDEHVDARLVALDASTKSPRLIGGRSPCHMARKAVGEVVRRWWGLLRYSGWGCMSRLERRGGLVRVGVVSSAPRIIASGRFLGELLANDPARVTIGRVRLGAAHHEPSHEDESAQGDWA